MMPDGFRRFGNLSLFLKPVFKKVTLAGLNCLRKLLKFKMIFYDSIRKMFSKHQNESEFKKLDDYFSGLRNSAASLTSEASATSLASTASNALFN
jgi:hypothetical protein